LDTPILRDQDNDAGYYTAANGYASTGWTGGALFKSTDGGANYNNIESFPFPGATIGTVTNAVGNYLGGYTVDEINSVNVVLNSGTLSSVTLLQMLNGSNAAVIGNEVIQFRDAVLTATNTYTLTGLIRGKVGTEQYISTHSAGDRFVLLSTTAMRRMTSSINEAGLLRNYKAVSIGAQISSTSQLSFTNNCNGLKPLSPVLIGGGRDASGNITINWTRRTRIGGGWNNFSDVPLGESAESYSIDIMSGVTVKRTLTSITPTVSYTSAQQVTDFGSNQSAVLVNIYQISATIGRGFVGIKTV
jgi:hypothetical protein